MWVKICGTTNVEDAQLAAESGADAVGFVFAPSRRQVTPAEVGRIAGQLGDDVERVGVFVGWSADEVAGTVEEAGLTSVQLHGELDLSLAWGLRHRLGTRVVIIQAIHWEAGEGGDAACAVASQIEEIGESGVVDRVLVDSWVGAALGGTGTAFDWGAAEGVFRERGEGVKLILAGGLRPNTVSGAIKRLQPWGVDAVSGVEAGPGRKDAEKVREFIRSAKAAHDGAEPRGSGGA